MARILVVEDREPLASTEKCILEEQGYDVSETTRKATARGTIDRASVCGSLDCAPGETRSAPRGLSVPSKGLWSEVPESAVTLWVGGTRESSF